jgi:hypothetical protein
MASRERPKKGPLRARPATTPEDNEDQAIALAYDLAKQQLYDGTASSQVIHHFLKMGSTREKLERQKMLKENDLLGARVKQIESAEKNEILYKNALDAMRRYNGQDVDEDDFDYD